jgi:hypothetical protein
VSLPLPLGIYYEREGHRWPFILDLFIAGDLYFYGADSMRPSIRQHQYTCPNRVASYKKIKISNRAVRYVYLSVNGSVTDTKTRPLR